MLYITLMFLAMAALADRATRVANLQNSKLEARFRLYALRDELRRKAIEGQIAFDNWFDYLDTTLTRTTGVIDAITIWGALVFRARHGKDPELLRARQALREALRKEENKEIANIYVQYLACIANLLEERHSPIVIALGRWLDRDSPEETPIPDRIPAGDSIKGEMVPAFSIVPETSTLLSHLAGSRRAGEPSREIPVTV